jgi:hypothetical protein
MAFKKGQSGNPAGRPAGAKDKMTSEIREAFQSLVEGNLNNIEAWLQATAEKDPAKALDFMLKLSEYTIPKLKAIQLTTGLNTNIHVTFPKEPNFE